MTVAFKQTANRWSTGEALHSLPTWSDHSSCEWHLRRRRNPTGRDSICSQPGLLGRPATAFSKKSNSKRILRNKCDALLRVFSRATSTKQKVAGSGRALNNDLKEIYEQHRQGLYSLAASLTGCTQHAEDAIHTAFEKLCRRNSRSTDDLTTYVFAAVRNSAIDLRRRQRRHARFASSLFSSPVTPVAESKADELVLTSERDQILRQAIDELESDDREIVVMKAFGQLTFEAIADVTNRPVGTVATRYRRALEKLHQRLRDKL